MCRKLYLVSIVVFLGSVALVCCAPPITPAPAVEEEYEPVVEETEPAGEPAAEEPGLGLSGSNPVTSNDEWTPVIEEFGGVEMALVPAGCFMMGSADEQVDYALELCEQELGPGECERDWFECEQPVHEVCFEEPFWIDVYEVTNAQYGSVQEDCTDWSSNDDQPRICADWFYAAAHCKGRGARLPTEAEWEYAARGPDGLIYPWGNDFVGDNMVYGENAAGHIWEVGSKPGGVSWIGALDMSGNAWEWVADWYDEDYYDTLSSPVTNPTGPDRPDSGEDRVLRGGSWDLINSFNLRAASRLRFNPDLTGGNFGFRCARSF